MRPRAIAIGLFRRDHRILVATGYDRVADQRFHRPLGGEIEFGERAEAALRREIREELGLEIRDLQRMAVLENVFDYMGSPGHEIVFVFDARFEDPRAYVPESLPIREAVWEGPARWIGPEDGVDLPLYPTGLSALLGWPHDLDTS